MCNEVSLLRGARIDQLQIMPLNFLPIEPPRTGNPNEETYARRQHQFSKIQPGSKKKSIFSRGSNSLRDIYSEPPRVSVDARLPNPSILTCNEPVPLRLLAKRLNEGPDIIFLQMLQVELIAYTKILAHDLTRTESGSWVVMSRSNMNIPLGKPEDPIGTDWTIDPGLWNRLPLPNSVAPSFETCNIERSYELEVRVGLTHGNSREMKVRANWLFDHLQANPCHSPNSSCYLCECQLRFSPELHRHKLFLTQWLQPLSNKESKSPRPVFWRKQQTAAHPCHPGPVASLFP